MKEYQHIKYSPRSLSKSLCQLTHAPEIFFFHYFCFSARDWTQGLSMQSTHSHTEQALEHLSLFGELATLVTVVHRSRLYTFSKQYDYFEADTHETPGGGKFRWKASHVTGRQSCPSDVVMWDMAGWYLHVYLCGQWRTPGVEAQGLQSQIPGRPKQQDHGDQAGMGRTIRPWLTIKNNSKGCRYHLALWVQQPASSHNEIEELRLRSMVRMWTSSRLRSCARVDRSTFLRSHPGDELKLWDCEPSSLARCLLQTSPGSHQWSLGFARSPVHLIFKGGVPFCTWMCHDLFYHSPILEPLNYVLHCCF